MLEGVLSIGRHPAPEDQFGAHKLRQRIVKAVLRHLSDGTDQLVRERASKRGTDLSDLPCRRQTVETSKQRALKGGRYRQPWSRARHGVTITSFCDDAAFDHGL